MISSVVAPVLHTYVYAPAGDTVRSIEPSVDTQVVGSTFVTERAGGSSTVTVPVAELEQLFPSVAVTV